MGQYRISRCVEKSVINWLTIKLSEANWSNVRVEKNFIDADREPLPSICVGADLIAPETLEIGSKTRRKIFEVSIRLFATDDGMRLDISDYLLDELEDDIPYYTYTIVNNIPSGVLSGKIIITEIVRHEKELTNTEGLEQTDKFRNITTFRCYVANCDCGE